MALASHLAFPLRELRKNAGEGRRWRGGVAATFWKAGVWYPNFAALDRRPAGGSLLERGLRLRGQPCELLGPGANAPCGPVGAPQERRCCGDAANQGVDVAAGVGAEAVAFAGGAVVLS